MRCLIHDDLKMVFYNSWYIIFIIKINIDSNTYTILEKWDGVHLYTLEMCKSEASENTHTYIYMTITIKLLKTPNFINMIYNSIKNLISEHLLSID